MAMLDRRGQGSVFGCFKTVSLIKWQNPLFLRLNHVTLQILYYNSRLLGLVTS